MNTEIIPGTNPIHAGRRVLSRTDCRYRRYENPDELLKEPKKDVWRVLINRMELRRILSVKKTEELNKQIESLGRKPSGDHA
jgi:hypothetical protein